MPAAWFHYWKPVQIRRNIRHGRIDHIASSQFGKLLPGDRVWIVGVENGELLTIGYVDVRERITREEARGRVSYEPFDATWHVLVPQEEAIEARRVSLRDIANALRFESRGNTSLDLSRGHVDAKQLQRIRRLTPGTAALVEDVWYAGDLASRREWSDIQREWDQTAPLDEHCEVIRRREQGFLRAMLFGSSPTGTCALCGRAFPIDLLVAAHIKRRADCTEEERRDFRNNVVPMCRLGCDELFERRYVTVIDRSVRVGPRRTDVPAVVEYLARIVNRPFASWTRERDAYFRWHAHA